MQLLAVWLHGDSCTRDIYTHPVYHVKVSPRWSPYLGEILGKKLEKKTGLVLDHDVYITTESSNSLPSTQMLKPASPLRSMTVGKQFLCLMGAQVLIYLLPDFRDIYLYF